MRLRHRILFSSVVMVWLPLILVAGLIQEEMGKRLAREHNRRVEALASVAEEDLKALHESLRSRLADFKTEIENDNRFRLGAVEGATQERAYVIDYAERAMRLLGLSALQVMDAKGRIVTSGHLRNEFDRVDPRLNAIRGCAGSMFLLRARQAEGPLLVLASMDSLHLAEQRFYLVGGVKTGERFLFRLSRGEGQAVTLFYPGGVLSSSPSLQSELAGNSVAHADWEGTFPPEITAAREFHLPFVGDEAKSSSATMVVSHSLVPLQQLQRNLNLWLSVVVLATVLGTLLLSLWASSRISRPLAALAARASQVDVEQISPDFPVGRKDEVGDLSRLLNSMISRLRVSVHSLRDAERRAALGELARQVNHDVRNGLTPLRNTLRHLEEVAHEDPASLPRIWKERESALKSSLAYLEGLAENYARLYRRSPRRPIDLGSVVREVGTVRRASSSALLEVRAATEPLPILADRIGLHRIVDNLVANAQESAPDPGGRVLIETLGDTTPEGARRVLLRVSDNGAGIPKESLARIFGDFYTTKAAGTGLGLSIVRRLVADYDGSLRVTSEVGSGTRFEVEFPPAMIQNAPAPSETEAALGETAR